MCSVVIHVTRWSSDFKDNLPWHPQSWDLMSRPFHAWTHPGGTQGSLLIINWQHAYGSLSGRTAYIWPATGLSLPKGSKLDPVGNAVQPLDTDKNHKARAEFIKIKLPEHAPGVNIIEQLILRKIIKVCVWDHTLSCSKSQMQNKHQLLQQLSRQSVPAPQLV